ncbi:putative acyl-CoA binding protein [Leishmania mexicana MHOM/GT/2001/U1103]|uniref:Acyl-CoA binding protein n=1 Tax=Leishmania mexicana (strain MHOM/GT/2001/U1103) TaxID=929439 RepID=E9AMS6_LEIMU|nr:putative acyl-CoA binding protein [Leishmania mexicana MHOM/GT/2001/U1103]CBZ24231.1 putative acyl-CoA binding protein [Leishmania mexicana MHOM/GT/2001/U1103]
MTRGRAADGAAVLSEFTVLRKPSEDNEHWYTAVHQGEPVTFRVLDDSGINPVDGAGYVMARVQAMQKHLQEACVDVAAEHAYRAVLVEVSLLDDPMAVPQETQRDMDCAMDLWCPLHVALMTSNKAAAQALLQFHVEHAVTAMTCIANTPRAISDPGAVDALDSPSVAPALDDDAPDASGADHTASVPSVAVSPILECHVHRELGGAVVLLGHFDGRIRLSSTAICKSRPSTPVRGGSPHAAPVSSTPKGIESAIAGGYHCSTGTAVAEDALVQTLCKHNDALLQEEDALFEDKGEEYCLRNILVAIRPLLQSIVLEIKRRAQCTTMTAPLSLHHHHHTHKASQECATPVVPESAIDFVHDYCSSLSMLPQHPPLLIDGDTVFDVCNHGDLALLAKVMDAFEGCFAPILRGQTLLTDRCAGGRGAGFVALTGAALHHNSSLSSPQSLSGTGQSSSPSLLSLGGDASAHSMAGTSHKGSVSRHSHTLPPAPFWWSRPPQNVHRLTFIAVWIGYREAIEESSGSGRRRHAVSISNENRVTMVAIRQLQESRVAAQKLDSTIWSGHLITITKLLSHECSLEDYVDFVEGGSYFAFTSPRGFSGLFLSVLVSGVMAAALVQEPAMLRVLRCKVETLLADVPGRPSPLRTYVMGRPSTHAERFRELWLDAGYHGVANTAGANGQNDAGDAGTGGFNAVGGIQSGERRPIKFRSRIELLYYVVVEQVVAAAEEAWTMHEAEDGDSSEAAGGSGAPSSSPPWPSGATKAEALTALQGWLSMWTNFLASLRDWTPHRGSFSCSTASSQMPQQERPQHNLNSGAEGHLTVGGVSPPLAATTAPHHQRTASSDDLFSDDANETTEMVQRVSYALVERLETGQEPLPALRRALFPNGTSDMETGAPAAGTSAHVDKALPVSSIDQEFASAQHAFTATAVKESDEVKLKFYGLFKQATIGDVNTDRPGIFDYAGKAKWDAWSKLKGISLLDAKRMYVSEYKMMVELRKSRK